MTQTIDLVYFSAGGGHRAAALALQEVMREQQRPWKVRLVNLAQVLDPKETFRNFTGIARRTSTTSAWHAAGRWGWARN